MTAILQKLKEQNRLHLSKMLFAISIFSATLSFIRIYFTGSPLFLFLNWNLFLAFIPWALTTSVQLKPHILKNKFALVFIVATWLLFFPNAPYIVTDLFHLRISTAAPLWFDTVLIMSFSWAGLVFGFVSLMDIENFISDRLSPLVRQLTISSLLFLSAFGIYLGRFLRWNSWDILRDPMHLFSDIGNRIINPVDHPTTWGVTLLMGLLLNMMYWTIRSLSVSKNP